MGGLVSCLATQTACCVGQTACSCLCKLCSTTSVASRIGYALLFIMTALLSLLALTDWASKKLQEISYGYLTLPCPEGQCHGVLAVYRICFTNSLFHGLCSLLMIGVENSRDWRGSIQNGYWLIKFAIWYALAALAFFIPNDFFVGLGKYINMPGASLFILVQVILLIDFAYVISENLLNLWEETDDKRYLGILLTLTFGCFISAIVLTGLGYAWFGSNQCPLNQFFISFNWILCLFVSLLSVTPRVQEENPKSGLAQAGIVSMYATYLIASAITSEPDSPMHCGPSNGKSETSTVVLGSFFTFLALAYSTSRAATESKILTAKEDSASVPLLNSDDEPHSPTDDEQEGVQYSYSFFHFIFVLGSMYLAMLLTNWDTVSKIDSDYRVGKSMMAVWVKVVSSWCVLILYLWTLIAPLVLPDRSWE